MLQRHYRPNDLWMSNCPGTQKRTLANLSKLPDHVVAALKAILKSGTLIGTGPDELQIERSLPHGHVAAALG